MTHSSDDTDLYDEEVNLRYHIMIFAADHRRHLVKHLHFG